MKDKKEWFAAARSGDYNEISRIIRDETAKPSKGKFKLSKSFSIDMLDDAHNTALHLACQYDRRELVELLLQNSANPNILDLCHCTALHLAAWNGNVEICDLLLKHQVDINKQNKEGDTALHIAARSGHVCVLKYLLDNRAYPFTTNAAKHTPLTLACQLGKINVVEPLLLRTQTQVRDIAVYSDNSPYHLAAKSGFVEIAQMLLNNHFNLSAVTESGSALHEAVKYSRKLMVQFLLSNRIDLDLKDRDDKTALQLCQELPTAKASGIAELIENYVAELAKAKKRIPSTSKGANDSGFFGGPPPIDSNQPETPCVTREPPRRPSEVVDSCSVYIEESPTNTRTSQSGGSRHVSQSGGSGQVSQSGGSRHVSQSGGSRHVSQSGGSGQVSQSGGSRQVSQSGGSGEVSQSDGCEPVMRDDIDLSYQACFSTLQEPDHKIRSNTIGDILQRRSPPPKPARKGTVTLEEYNIPPEGKSDPETGDSGDIAEDDDVFNETICPQPLPRHSKEDGTKVEPAVSYRQALADIISDDDDTDNEDCDLTAAMQRLSAELHQSPTTT